MKLDCPGQQRLSPHACNRICATCHLLLWRAKEMVRNLGLGGRIVFQGKRFRPWDRRRLSRAMYEALGQLGAKGLGQN